MDLNIADILVHPRVRAQKAKKPTVFTYTTPHFSIGVKGRVAKRKKRPAFASPIVAEPFVPKTWYILPLPIDPTLKNLMNRIGKSFRDALITVHCVENSIKKAGFTDRLLGFTPDHIHSAYAIIRLNNLTERRLRRFAIQWKRRHLKRANEEDLITMDVPIKEVILYDWAQKCTYHFEASSILRCIVKRLIYHAGHFATPIMPANPYTNVTLTTGQLLSITDQLKAFGFTHWALEALRAAQYSWLQFTTVNDLPLQMEAMKNTFGDTNNPELHETLYDFIDSEYTINDMEFDSGIYRWAIQNAIDSPHMLEWRKLCLKYYWTSLIYREVPIKQKCMQQIISAAARNHCFPRELYVLRRRNRTPM